MQINHKIIVERGATGERRFFSTTTEARQFCAARAERNELWRIEVE